MADVSILFAGDYAPIINQDKKVDYNVSVDNVFKKLIQEHDHFVVNLECPVTDHNEKRLKAGVNLRGKPEQADRMAELGINIASIANNHIFDYEIKGCIDTIENIERNNIQWFGVGPNAEKAAQPLIIKKNNIKIALLSLAEHEFNWISDDDWCTGMLDPVRNIFQIQQLSNKCDYVIVYIHGGPENWQYPSPRMVKLARAYVDAGADTILFAHAHCIMGKEIYKDKPIYYGLGNLFFPYDGKPDYWYHGMCVSLKLHNNADKISYKMYPLFFDTDGSIRIIDENDSFIEHINELSIPIGSGQLLQQKWDMFCNTQERKLLGESMKGFGAMLPFAAMNYLFKNKFKAKPDSLYAKGSTLIRGLLTCENHVEVLSRIFELKRKEKN